MQESSNANYSWISTCAGMMFSWQIQFLKLLRRADYIYNILDDSWRSPALKAGKKQAFPKAPHSLPLPCAEKVRMKTTKGVDAGANEHEKFRFLVKLNFY